MAEAANISIDNKDIGEKNDDKPTDGAVDVEGINIDTKGEQMENNLPRSSTARKTEEDLKKKLKKHFSDPYTRVCREKTIRKKCPEKLTILIIKFFFVTAQLCMFGADRAVFAKYLDRNNIAMKHLLLKGWQPEFETMPYPPTSGDYALYRIEELFEHIDYAITALDEIPKVALGSFFVNDEEFPTKPVKLCVEYFNRGRYNKSGKIEIDSTITTDCTYVGIDNVNSSYGLDPSLKDLVRSTDGNLVRLLQVRLSFSVDSVFVHMEKTVRELQCFRIFGEVNFNNYGINGQIPVTMKTRIEERACQGESSESDDYYVLFIDFDFADIFGCLHLLQFLMYVISCWKESLLP